jgi:hypothetical protein
MVADLEAQGVDPKYLSEMKNVDVGKMLRRWVCLYFDFHKWPRIFWNPVDSAIVPSINSLIYFFNANLPKKFSHV